MHFNYNLKKVYHVYIIFFINKIFSSIIIFLLKIFASFIFNKLHLRDNVIFCIKIHLLLNSVEEFKFNFSNIKK